MASSDGDWTIRLPTEAEWEAVATPDGRTYPWGNQEPDLERTKFGGNVGSASPVGVYPAGDGAYGHSDLAGNVWEWMDDAWDRTKDSAVKRTYSSAAGRRRRHRLWHSHDRVGRGGSWFNYPRIIRSAYRIGANPTTAATASGSGLPGRVIRI